ncbi:MAG: stage III sporulation protein AE [Lachnospiraceae bacterium]|nr:stage III sporulation protein AE [Lachnospiraceae bacterium]
MVLLNATMEVLEDDFDFSAIQEVLNSTVNGTSFDFFEKVKEVVFGGEGISFSYIWNLLLEALFADINKNKEAVIMIILIGISAAVFANISNAFLSGQIAQTAFYITYLLFVSVVAVAFHTMSESAVELLRDISDFMQALVPVFCLSLGMVSGGAGSLMFYEIALGSIFLVDTIFLNVIVPLIDVYVVLIMVNYLSKEDFLSKAAELIHTIVKWGLNTIFAMVLGINVIQGIMVPVSGTIKNQTLAKAVSAIPGIGSGANAVWETVLGTGVIIKNGIGSVALIAIGFMVSVPIVKMMLFVLMYQGAGAILQPVSDKRVSEVMSGIGAGAKLLLNTVILAMVFFVVSIALVCISTNGGLA